MASTRESLGVCVGASTIGVVRVAEGEGGVEVRWAKTRAHEGNPRRTLRSMLESVEGLADLPVAATGRKFRHHLALATISEPEAIEWAVPYVLPAEHPYRIVVSAGGETFMVYHLDGENRIQGIYSGNKCASGTGEFFLQQLGRMGLSVDEVQGMAAPERFHAVSGRCSVFCKSDCTHALNKGIPKAEVVAGLSRMLAGKALELLHRLPKGPVLLIGGCSANTSMVHYLREAIDDLHIPEAAPWFEALGAALWALRGAEGQTSRIERLDRLFREGRSSLSFLKPLSESAGLVEFKQQSRISRLLSASSGRTRLQQSSVRAPRR